MTLNISEDPDQTINDLIQYFDSIQDDVVIIGDTKSFDAKKSLKRLLNQRNFYKKRVKLLYDYQSSMRDPERTLVCDILANGQLLPDSEKKRYPYFNIDFNTKLR